MPTPTSSPPTHDVAPVLRNRPYEFVRFLGRGGVGEVWLVRSTQMGRLFALKILHRRHVKNRFFVERFELEARGTALIAHPNVVSVSDYWIADDGRHCLVMEYLEGHTLASEIMTRKSLPAPEVIRYGCQALKALSAAHAKGLVHRDIKPENLFLHRVPNTGFEVKLLDFGLARVASGESDSGRFRPMQATQTGTAVGSPRFSSPEALRGKLVDHRTDIYSLGVVLYVSLVGLYCGFDASTRPTFLPPSFQGADGCSSDLDAVILRAVETRPDDRYQSALQFLEALEPFHPTVQFSRHVLPREMLLKP